MTQERIRNVNEADASQSEHEREVEQHVESRRDGSARGGATEDPGRRPTSSEDLAADRRPGDDDADTDRPSGAR